MADRPRLTGSLRAFSGVSSPTELRTSDAELTEELILKRKWKNSQNTLSWTDLKNIVQERCQPKDKSKGLSLVRELATSSNKLVGSDTTKEAVESAAIHVFELFRGCEQITALESKKLKELFGPFPASIASKCHNIVKQIVNLLPEDTFIDSQDKRTSKIKRFGHNLAINLTCDNTLVSDSSDSEDESADNQTDAFIGQFRDKMALHRAGKAEHNTNKDNQWNKGQRPNGNQSSNVCQKSNRKDLWLLDQCRKYFSGKSGTLSVEDMATAIYDILCSSKNNEEIQNELFELAGFDAFELIQQVLERRQTIVNGGYLLEEARSISPANFNGQVTNGESMPSYGRQVTIQSEQEKLLMKLSRKEEKKMAKLNKGLMPEYREPTIPKDPLFRSRGREVAAEIYPHVYDSMAGRQQATASIGGTKILLPSDVVRENHRQYEEVYLPPTMLKPPRETDNFVKISQLDDVGQLIFKNIKSLNRIQSIVFDAAYNTNENLLVCAPTGAGKTNIALLSIVQEIKKNIHNGVLKRDEFKIVYVAPMKALAAEMVRNFGKKLEPLNISVKELTGDMQLTKTEILKTQMLVTTPEKWDVVTRKSTGDVALSQLVKLLIIDEVHLLHDDRGSVIESLVARTLRQVEATQSMIRILGLSATLPNYLDVARFLNVNPYKGLFFFDGRFRPVPLAQTFIGIKALGVVQQLKDMDEVCYEKVLDNVEKGHQVMVFVHARNATVKTALLFREMASNRGDTEVFQATKNAEYGAYEKQVLKSRNKQLREMFPDGFGIHHAGMLRQDRNLVENLFSKGLLKVLVCTATLAWGVNLPAHAVIIKGTEIYDAKKGAFVDLGILDVMQIFGRAGRPQFDKDGHGYIITKHEKLSHYLSLLTRQSPIESQFVQSLTDNLNAEISLGTVSNVEEGAKWLSYTYLYVRMRLNPIAYGINYKEKEEDPLLEKHRLGLIRSAGRALDKARMIRFEERTGFMYATDLGRTSSHFYIKYNTIEIFNGLFKPEMTDVELFAMISLAQEFQQIKVREDELQELENHLHDDCWIHPVKGGVENEHGKVNCLLQTYISKGIVESFSLISDMSYVAQNAARIVSGLFEVALRKGWPAMASKLLTLSKTVDKRIWEGQHPLRQCEGLTFETLRKLEDKKLTMEKLQDMEAKEIGHMIHHVKMGSKIKSFVQQFPAVSIASSIQPITRTVLRVRLIITPEFTWNDRMHGSVAEPFWIWVEDPDNDHIYHSEYLLLTKKQVKTEEPQALVFTIPIFEPLPTQYYIRVVSDRWLGAEAVCAVSFKHLILPEKHPPHTELLDLQPLPITVLKSTELEMLYNFTHFNPVQTQIFHTLYYSDHNVLLGAPTGSGKTVAAELAIFRTFREYPGTKAVYIAPLKALVRERMDDWKIRIEQKLGRKVVELTGDTTPDMRAIANADLIVTTPEKWDGVSRSWQTRSYVKDVSLLVIDEIHLLGDERGPVLEVIVSRTNFIASHTTRPMRIVGLSTALANARDLADWLGIGQAGMFNFRPSVRPVPLEVHIQGFPGKHYCPRMASMNKPAFKAIQTHSPEKPVLIFVSSRRQTRITAIDLIAFLAADDNPKQWLHIPEEEMANLVSVIRDQNLKLTLSFGIGLHHAGLHERDRRTVEELFVNQKIQVLIATSTLAWGVNFPAHLVIVKGTEYFEGKTRRYVDFPITDVLQMMGRAGRPQFDDQGVACIFVHDVKKHFYKKFLYEPFPVESSLLEVLPDHLNAEIVAGTITSKQDAMDYITWTYFFRRLLMNPTYYDLKETSHDSVNTFLSDLVQKAISDIERSYCIQIGEDDRSIEATTLGRISSYYYLSHKTLKMFNDRLTSTNTTEELVQILSDAHEYEQLPVRHNEDSMNSDLAPNLPIQVDPYSFDSPHTKTCLLFQAHFSRHPLPIADYGTDTKSILDQAIRILQAMIDVAADQGWLATALRVMGLIQMAVQGRWHTDCSLLTIPHVDHDLLRYFRLQQRGKSKSVIIDSIPELLLAYKGNMEILRRMLDKVLSLREIEQIHQYLTRLPQLSFRMALSGFWADQEDGKRKRKSIDTEPKSPLNQEWIQVHADQEYTIQVEANRLHGGNRKLDSKAQAPLFPKPKDEGWFFALGEIDSGELVALKRVGFIRRRQNVSLAFYTPEELGRKIFTLFIMSDSYFGLDQQYDLHLEVIQPDISSQLNTEVLDSDGEAS